MSRSRVVPRYAANRLLAPTTLVRDAHRAGLALHPWTFRRENSFLPEDFRQGNAAHPLYLAAPGNLLGELELFYKLGVDGLFSDNPGHRRRSPLEGVRLEPLVVPALSPSALPPATGRRPPARLPTTS